MHKNENNANIANVGHQNLVPRVFWFHVVKTIIADFVVRQSTDWLMPNSDFSPNDYEKT